MAWFESVEIGTRWDSGPHLFTEEAIVAFAAEYDPQPFHLDPVAAREGPFRGLVASGWHTAALWMRGFVQALQERETPGAPPNGPSPGFRDLRWPAPVRPGDRISYSTTVIEKTDWRGRPDWGFIRYRGEGVNQNGERVLLLVAGNLMKKRETS